MHTQAKGKALPAGSRGPAQAVGPIDALTEAGNDENARLAVRTGIEHLRSTLFVGPTEDASTVSSLFISRPWSRVW